MISAQALVGLRIAATLVHGVPGLQLAVRGHRDEPEVSVRWRGPDTSGPRQVRRGGAAGAGAAERGDAGVGFLDLTPCAFRSAVAQAYALHEQGRRMAFLDLAPGCDPRIEITPPPRGAVFAGGIYRVPLGGRWLFAFATTLDASRCRATAADLVHEALPLDMLAALGVRSDEDTGVSIVYAETAVRVAPHPSRPVSQPVDRPLVGTDDESRVVELLQAMLARLATQELIIDIEGTRVDHS